MMSSTREWKEFELINLFHIISGRDVISSNYGKFPYINSSGINNGVTKFIDSGIINVKNCITVARTGTVGATFYQKNNVFISGNIRTLVLKGYTLNEYIALFLVASIKKSIYGRFDYGKILGTERLKKIRILLPVKSDNKNEPDWQFMEDYMIELEESKKAKYKKHLDNILSNIEYKEIDELNDVEWRDFYITEICDIESGHDIYEAEREIGNIPYITSTSSNNGIKYFVSNTNSTLESNAISVNRNGSVGYCFYHKYSALYSNDCRKLILKSHRNEYVSLFITNQITNQKGKYSYGYKMGTNRLKKQKIMLPINDKEEPDFEYMEQYIKNLTIKKYNQYLNCNK